MKRIPIETKIKAVNSKLQSKEAKNLFIGTNKLDRATKKDGYTYYINNLEISLYGFTVAVLSNIGIDVCPLSLFEKGNVYYHDSVKYERRNK